MSIPLAINNNAQGALFGPRLANPTSPLTIAMVKDALEWGSDGGQDAEELRGLANYLYWLCGKYGLQAQRIIGTSSGGGTVVPGTLPATPAQLNFIVAASGTTLIDGQSEVTLSSFVGFNLVVVKNGTGLTQITTAPVYYTWNRTTGLLTISPAASTGDEFQITAV